MNLEKEVFDISLKDIMPNRFQPREIFDEQELKELSKSIKEHGVIQPIIVRKVGDKYEIIAGERRYRASLLAGNETIPALVRDIDDKETAKIALLENLQRSNLTPIEEAKTYQTILKLDNITQEELATNLGKSQSTVANKLRLLSLDEEVQTALLNRQISERHARSLLNISDFETQKKLLNKVIMNRMTVRQLDEEITAITGKTIIEEPEEEQPMTEEQNIDVPLVNEEELKTPEPVNNIFETLRKQSQQQELKEEPIMPTTNDPQQDLVINTNEEINKEEPIINIPDIDNGPQQESMNIPTTNETVVQEPIINIPEQNAITEPDYTNQEEEPKVVTQDSKEYNEVYDLRFAINNIRQAIQNTEKFGFTIEAQEFDLDNIYQIIIKINKDKF